MSLYYADDTITLHHGKNLDVLPQIPADSIDCVVTSPPYFGLRDYGIDGQYGAEATPAEFVANLVATFREIRRVLAKDGTVWLNLGDSYASDPGNGRGSGSMLQGRKHEASGSPAATAVSRKPGVTIARKNLMGMPWRVAFALQDDGWILRNAIVWNKPNAMPESVTDRLSTRHEMVFLFSKSPRYWFDLDPIREDLLYPELADGTRVFGGKTKGAAGGVDSTARRRGGNAWTPKRSGTQTTAEDTPSVTGADTSGMTGAGTQGRNPGDVWTISTTPFSGAHFAVFPPEIPRRCIVAGCKPGGTVLDPFHGSGTTGMVATRNGRKYVGIELSKDYLDLSLRTRLGDGTLNFEATQ